ncbi:FlhC family transcriptional regulator [Candidatus Thiodiazotropha sp. LNASS1]|uniref:FlhC family transcriptional regulator n=1 Tax=Candidatus Thiodiazotropha sp. LNASS1 TaxID=3096260 RepID=UPI0034DE2FF1
MCVGNTDRLLALIARKESEANTPGNIDLVNQARHTLEAVHLVKLGARASLVCQLTGLTKKVVSGLYPLLTGMSSPPGQVPFTDTWYLKCNRRLLHANLVWRLFQHLEIIKRTAAKVLIHVYEVYVEIVDAPLLNLTRAFFVPRLVRIKAWYEQTCDHCGMSYIGPLDNGGSVCPACKEYFNHRCRSCGGALEYHPMGRRKVVCSECYERQRRNKKRLNYGGIDG